MDVYWLSSGGAMAGRALQNCTHTQLEGAQVGEVAEERLLPLRHALAGCRAEA